MPPVVFMILGGIQAAIQAFPQVKAIVEKGKDLISSLTGQVITVEQQNALHSRIDEISDAAQRGEIPRGWTVDADPAP